MVDQTSGSLHDSHRLAFSEEGEVSAKTKARSWFPLSYSTKIDAEDAAVALLTIQVKVKHECLDMVLAKYSIGAL